MLTRPAGTVLFLEPHSGAVITLSDVEVFTEVVVNGPVELAMAQYLDDMAVGGAAAVACSRKREVRNGCPHRPPDLSAARGAEIAAKAKAKLPESMAA